MKACSRIASSNFTTRSWLGRFKKTTCSRFQLNAFVHDDIDNMTGAGVWQRIDLKLETGSFEWVHDPGEENYATDGDLDVDNSHYDNGVRIPFDATGEARLRLVGPNDFSFTALGTRVKLVIAGPPTDRELGRA